MNGRKAKALRKAAKEATTHYYPRGYDELNVRTRREVDPFRTTLDGNGKEIPIVHFVTTRTLVRQSCGKSLVRMLKGTKASKVMA